MKLQIHNKSITLHWEYCIAPIIVLLAILLLVINGMLTRPTHKINTEQPQQATSSPILHSEKPSSSPFAEEGSASSQGIQAQQEKKLVNINTASKKELESLPYIGAVKAEAIIEYRTKNGPFKKIDDMLKVKGIGKKTLDKLRNLICVS